MNELSVRNETEEMIDGLPWLVFKLHNLTYTVNSRIVSAILQYPDNVTPVASAPESFRGIINFREGILPLLDLRTVFHMKSGQEDSKVFMELINQMKNELDNYRNLINQSISSDFEKIEHIFTTEMLAITKWRHQAQRHSGNGVQVYDNLPISLIERFNELETYSKNIFKKIKSGKFDEQQIKTSPDYKGFINISSDVHKILSDSVDAFQESNKEMVVAIAKGEVSLGLIVDEVVAVEDLDIVSNEERFPKFQKANFFVGVAHSTRVDGEILIINEELIMKLSNEFESNS